MPVRNHRWILFVALLAGCAGVEQPDELKALTPVEALEMSVAQFACEDSTIAARREILEWADESSRIRSLDADSVDAVRVRHLDVLFKHNALLLSLLNRPAEEVEKSLGEVQAAHAALHAEYEALPSSRPVVNDFPFGTANGNASDSLSGISNPNGGIQGLGGLGGLGGGGGHGAAKPVIYLYPQRETEVVVKLALNGTLGITYPDYDSTLGGWRVMASPNGILTNLADKQQYSYLFWEGEFSKMIPLDKSQGFVVKGEETAAFLKKTLKEMGLLPKEYNEFIVYWMPRMKNNRYNFIRFLGSEYDRLAPLTVMPKPDAVLRVFMVFQPVEKAFAVEPQEIKKFQRAGFTVAEWGGCEAKAPLFGKAE